MEAIVSSWMWVGFTVIALTMLGIDLLVIGGRRQHSVSTHIAITGNQIHATIRAPFDGTSRSVTARVGPALAKDLAPFDGKFTDIVESTFLREGAAAQLEREMLRETDLERIRALAVAPVLPLPNAS